MTSVLRCGFLTGMICLIPLSISGCGGGAEGPKLVDVEGEVSFDGNPVSTGQIVFRSADGGRSDAGQITDGTYQASVTPGKKTVEITATREVAGGGGTLESGEEVLETEQYIPEQYNTATTLEWEVPENGGTKAFDLKSE